MAAREIQLSLDADVVARATRAAEAQGTTLVAWLTEAVVEAAGLAEARAAIGELDAAYGAPSEADVLAAYEAMRAEGHFEPFSADREAARRSALARLHGESPWPARRQAG